MVLPEAVDCPGHQHLVQPGLSQMSLLSSASPEAELWAEKRKGIYREGTEWPKLLFSPFAGVTEIPAIFCSSNSAEIILKAPWSSTEDFDPFAVWTLQLWKCTKALQEKVGLNWPSGTKMFPGLWGKMVRSEGWAKPVQRGEEKPRWMVVPQCGKAETSHIPRGDRGQSIPLPEL